MPDETSHLADDQDSPTMEPYRAVEPSADGEPATNASSTAKYVLWMTPAIVLVALMWCLLIVPGKIVPLTLIHFVSMQGGPILGVLLLSIWWFASRRLPLSHRFVGWFLAIATIILTFVASDPSMPIIVLVYLLPISLTVLIALLSVTASVAWPRRGWIGWIGFSVSMFASLLFRATDQDASFHFGLATRWSPTAEEQFLAELESQDESPEAVITLPEEHAEGDWAEFRGPRRDGILTSVRIATDWQADPPKEIWRRNVGPGWSSFCVIGPMIVTQEQRDQTEVVAAYRLQDGVPIWTNEISARFTASMGGIGPRATPTYRSGKIYATGAAGLVQCLDAKTGQSLWQYHLIDDLGASMPMWGFASSPLVINELVIVFAGGGDGKGVVALNRESGEVVWTANNGTHGYSSAQLSEIDGVQQVLISSNRGLQSLDPANGELLWQHAWDIGDMARVTQPLVVDNTVYLGTGYGNGTRRIDVQFENGNWTATEGWTSRLKPYFNDSVYYEGHLYGFDGDIFMSIDAETGDQNWKKGRYGNGQVLLLKEMGVLLVLTEKGKVLLVNADPEKHEEIAEIKALEGVTWNHPVIVDGKLLVRNAEEMACYELPGYQRVE
ncbi:PQQ-binding-like beta-propeller repeat protein [Stieleria varia]|uniref:Quinoprotein ethanol dehydrogenase n=1 Tax=Stieleria varia TaxID=2528005 RepID=A0A5C6A1B1_9BACT|nr:PQQ-binding-like beta-propeller repeat protein [Stieleria varia]TWT93359.1 Quinoprotein ethanol dehydrogenase precursor [Stieleria varia]